MKHVILLTGAGQIGMAIARRMGYGMKIVMGDKTLENAQAIAKTMNDAGFDVIAMETDISSQSGWRIPALTPAEDEALACTPTEELLGLDFLQRSKIRDTLHACQLAKRCNEKRVMAESVKWGARGARLNANAAGIIVTPLAIDEFNGPRGASTRICSPSARRAVPAQRTRSPTPPSCS